MSQPNLQTGVGWCTDRGVSCFSRCCFDVTPSMLHQPWGQPGAGSTSRGFSQEICLGTAAAQHLPCAILAAPRERWCCWHGRGVGRAGGEQSPAWVSLSICCTAQPQAGLLLLRPAKLSPSKAAQQALRAALCQQSSKDFQASSCTGKRIPKHQAGGVRRVTLTPLLVPSFDYLCYFSLLLIENTEFK